MTEWSVTRVMTKHYSGAYFYNDGLGYVHGNDDFSALLPRNDECSVPLLAMMEWSVTLVMVEVD